MKTAQAPSFLDLSSIKNDKCQICHKDLKNHGITVFYESLRDIVSLSDKGFDYSEGGANFQVEPDCLKKLGL